MPAAPNQPEDQPEQEDEIEEIGGPPPVATPADAAATPDSKRSRTSADQPEEQAQQLPKPKKRATPAKSPKAKAKQAESDTTEAVTAPPAVGGTGLDKVITQDMIDKATMAEPQKVYFDELVFDEERKFGQVRRLRDKMWKEYFEGTFGCQAPSQAALLPSPWMEAGRYAPSIPPIQKLTFSMTA